MTRRTLWQHIGFGLLAALLALVLGSAANDTHQARAQDAGSPTSTASILQLPTATPTLIGGPSATPSRTPSYAPVIAQALGEVNLRSGPGVNMDIVGTLKAGDTVPVIGRSVQYPWYVVAWKDGPNGQAWVYKDVVTIIGDITTVPIVEAPALPTIEPTQFALEQTATVALQTPGAPETATAAAFFQPTGIYTITPAAGALAGGPLPTFTPPDPLAQPKALAAPPQDPAARAEIPPAVLIIALGATGLLFLGLGLLRRAL